MTKNIKNEWNVNDEFFARITKALFASLERPFTASELCQQTKHPDVFFLANSRSLVASFSLDLQGAATIFKTFKNSI